MKTFFGSIDQKINTWKSRQESPGAIQITPASLDFGVHTGVQVARFLDLAAHWPGLLRSTLSMKTFLLIAISLISLSTMAQTTKREWVYGSCEEHTPSGSKVRDLPEEECRRALGSKLEWVYGSCEEHTPRGYKIRGRSD
ncbi:MAG: hypothetical protein K2X47_00565, partial [Bdellovibrionales bacterium]|nr:hypothetical protein [Bdellovibrionales bacterium]